jgi:NTP pyrophosphatase (non-canonical NTP hydrolase)
MGTQGRDTVMTYNQDRKTELGAYIEPVFAVLMNEVNALTTEKGWRTDDINNKHAFAAYIALAHSELSETLEAYRDKQWSETRKDGKPVGVGPELADVVIRVLDMCDRWEINIAYEIERVLNYGWTRPYQHGGRTL